MTTKRLLMLVLIVPVVGLLGLAGFFAYKQFPHRAADPAVIREAVAPLYIAKDKTELQLLCNQLDAPGATLSAATVSASPTLTTPSPKPVVIKKGAVKSSTVSGEKVGKD
jgi:hypothetical protein